MAAVVPSLPTPTEVSRTFDLASGAIHLVIQDQYGQTSNHTLYLKDIPDVEAAVASLLTSTGQWADAIRAKMITAGWTPAP